MLQKQNVQISFAKGIDTKTDAKQVVAGKLLTLENGYFKTTNEIRKRDGTTQKGNLLSNAGNYLAQYNNELIAGDSNALCSYSQDQNLFNAKGSKVAVDLITQSVVKTGSQQVSPDYNTVSGIGVYAWEDSTGGVRYSVFDEITNQSIVYNLLLSATGVKPKVKVLGLNLIITYVETASNDLRYVAINSSTPNIVSSPMVLDTNITNQQYDITSGISSLVYVVSNTSLGFDLFTLNTALIRSAITSPAISTLGATATSILFDSTLNQYWIIYNDGAGVQYFIVSSALVTVLPLTLIEGVLGINITGVVNNGSGIIYYEIPSPTLISDPITQALTPLKQDEYIRKANATNLGVVTNVTDYLRSVGLASKAFNYNGDVYVLVTHDSALQPTYFLTNLAGSIVTKIAPSNGGGLTTKSILPEVVLISSNVFKFPFLIKDSITAVSGLIYTQTGVSSAQISFGQTLVNKVLGNNLHVSGGILSMYDGANVVEHGFNLYPENDTVLEAWYGGALTAGQQYQYNEIYEWTDNQGQVHRSSPSVGKIVTDSLTPLTYTTNLVSGNTTFIIQVNSQPKQLNIGMLVTGPGIPANTTLVSASNTAPNPGGGRVYTITISNSITATTNPAQVVFTPNINLSLSAKTLNRNLVTLDQLATPITSIFRTAMAINNTNTFAVSSTQGLRIGMNVQSTFGDIPASIITNITNNLVTINNTYGASGQDLLNTITVTLPFTANSAGAGFITAIIPASALTGLAVGNYIFDPRDSSYHLITTISGTSVFLATPIASGTSIPLNLVFNAQDFLFPGNILTIQTATNGAVSTGTIQSITGNNIYIKETNTRINNNVIYNVFNVFTNISKVPTLRLTDKQKVVISLYRTQGNGVISYRVTTISIPVFNDKTVDYVYLGDQVSDLNIIGNDQLYTTGGEVENISAPAAYALTTYKNRMILIPEENQLTWWYSKQVIPTSPVEFSDIFVNNIDQLGGNITAVAPLDDKLIFFKQNNIFYVVGDGPAPNGTQNDFTQSQLVTSDAGCINKKSIVNVPNGIMFQSAKGIYILNRALQVQYIGADVELYNNQGITSAVLIETSNQVRFSLTNGTLLVYDYFYDQWSVYTNYSAQDAINYEANGSSTYHYIKSTGQVNNETPGVFNDNGSFIVLNILTSWLSLAQLQGFERIRELLILGEYKSNHNLNVRVGYNFIPATYTQNTVIPVTVAQSPYQYRIFMAQQKCQSIQFSISDSSNGVNGESLSISNMALRVGVKAGLNKMAAVKSYG